jgi:predicted RNA-binding Zn-ribbon protein involved in translation (DUF1610 family)
LKKCPLCAEEIQEEAIKCRYCGSDLGRKEPLEIPEAAGISFTQVGDRYLLGGILAERRYGIWDRQNPGPPLKKFPFGERGWKSAYAEFSSLQPEHRAVASKIKCPTCGSSEIMRITGVDKVATAALVGVFALGRISKSFQCQNCGYKW